MTYLNIKSNESKYCNQLPFESNIASICSMYVMHGLYLSFQGVTFAFWLKLLGTVTGMGGILTSTPANGPGLRVYWDNTNLAFSLKRDSDSIHEWSGIWHTHFLANYSYNQWFHCVVTHKMDGCGVGNNIRVYLNGSIVTQINKFADPWDDGPNLADYNGNLDIGTARVGTHTWGTGNFQMDDLIIWESQISSEDVNRLFMAYG